MHSDEAITGKVEIVAKDLSVAYGKTTAFITDDFKLRGRVIAVIGHNGSGKSTMLKSLLQLLVPRSGSIQSYWVDKGERSILVPEQHMAFSPENGAVFEDMPVESYIRLWCRIKQSNVNYYKKQGRSVIEQLNIDPLFSKLGRELSKGQRRRVQAAVGFLCNPRLFLFDEPFDGLDIMQSTELASIMLEESKRMSIIVSSHRMEVVERIADIIVVLRDGKVHSHGDVDEVCNNLCGGSVLVSSADENRLPVESLLPLLRKEFYSCLINQIGKQLVLTGTDAKVESLANFFAQQQIRSVKVDSVRPSLVDAMRYHLDRIH